MSTVRPMAGAGAEPGGKQADVNRRHAITTADSTTIGFVTRAPDARWLPRLPSCRAVDDREAGLTREPWGSVPFGRVLSAAEGDAPRAGARDD